MSLVEKTKLFDSVESFMDALEALEYLTDNKADLALLDIDMPQMSGIELATNIRTLFPDIGCQLDAPNERHRAGNQYQEKVSG